MKAMAFFLIFATRLALASGVSVTMTAEHTEITLEEQLEVQVAVKGVRDSIRPDILNAQNFDVQAAGTQTQMQIINGQMSQQVAVNFVLVPKAVGKFRIGPARVTVAGQQYESAPIDVTVVKAARSQAGQDRYFYVVGEVDNKTPYVNQLVNYTFKFYNRAELANAQLGLPEFKGFLKESAEKQREYEQIVNGVRWHVTAIRIPLFPTAPGQITIESAHIAAEAVLKSQRGDFFEDFFAGARTKRLNLRSEPIQLTVRSLPSDRPASFSGLVGQFSLSAQIGKQALAVGDSSTLTVTVDGTGNLSAFALPEIKSQDFKLYDDQPTFTARMTESGWKSTKTFKRALVPVRPGQIELPPISLTYFDPSTNSFRTAESPHLKLVATGTQADESVHHVAAAQGADGTKKSIEVLGTDLMPIKRSPSALRSDVLSASGRLILLLLYGACPLIYGVVFGLKRRRDRLSTDKAFLRRRKAYSEFSNRLKKLGENGSLYQETSTLLREYLGDKFNLDGKAITPIDIERKLGPLGVAPEAIKRIESFLRDCEAGQFGGLGQDGQKAHRESLVAIVEGLEKGGGR